MLKMTDKKNKLVVFQSKNIRRIWYEEQWYYSVVDIVAALTNSTNPRDYWYKMKTRVKQEDGFEPSTVCRQFKMEAPDGLLPLRLVRSLNSWSKTIFPKWEKWLLSALMVKVARLGNRG